MASEPLLGWRAVKLTGRRTAVDFAEFVAWSVEEVQYSARVGKRAGEGIQPPDVQLGKFPGPTLVYAQDPGASYRDTAKALILQVSAKADFSRRELPVFREAVGESR